MINNTTTQKIPHYRRRYSKNMQDLFHILDVLNMLYDRGRRYDTLPFWADSSVTVITIVAVHILYIVVVVVSLVRGFLAPISSIQTRGKDIGAEKVAGGDDDGVRCEHQLKGDQNRDTGGVLRIAATRRIPSAAVGEDALGPFYRTSKKEYYIYKQFE